jgi:2-haloacid dehalogenase
MRGTPWKEAIDDLSARHSEKAELIAAYDLNWDEMISGPIPGTADLLWELNAFDSIVISGEVQLLKPDAAIYRHLLDRHHLRAEDTLFIDDVEHIVEGARAVGMHAVKFTDVETLRNDLKGYGLR